MAGDELLTAAQMREIERAAIESGAATGLELMERAGAGAVEAILEEWPELREGARRAVVLCGPGNNGGDGFVVARLLKERGWAVECFLYGDPEKLPPDARTNFQRWVELGAIGEADTLVSRSVWPQFDADAPDMDLFIDAVFGIGQSRVLPRTIEEIASALNHRDEEPARGWVVSLDIPSGLSSDSGTIIGGGDRVFYADLTLSLHAAKIGHFVADGPKASVRVRTVDIGLEDEARRQYLATPEPGGPEARSRTTLISRSAVAHTSQKSDGHKFDHGHALVISGGVGRGGAARMAARGALRIGAGLVTVGCPPAALIENAAQLDAIMLRSVKDAEALEEMLKDARINALCLGPGLGMGVREAGLVRAALESRRATVLDGDALTLLAQDEGLMPLLHGRCLLTPHMGEFARLFPDIAERLEQVPTKGPAYSKVDAARDAAARAGCTVLLKGPDTVIAAPDGEARINSAHYERRVPWLATAGAGDVLAGFAAGLMARGKQPLDAAASAAWLHVECARAFGPGLIAEDLPDVLPQVLGGLAGG